MTRFMHAAAAFLFLNILSDAIAAEDGPLNLKPIPAVQIVPLPDHVISFQHRGRELVQYHYDDDQERPFWFPLIGPSGNQVTRMGHPHDPESHSHHNSVWVSHFKVNDVDYWGDRGQGRIRHQRIVEFKDGNEAASATMENAWIELPDKRVLKEIRRMEVRPEANGEWFLIVDLEFEAEQEVTFGKTPFGFMGVRMTRNIGVHDGGGRILNSGGAVNEGEVFWNEAHWVDYSGRTAQGVMEGVTLMDHPANPDHPPVFHVRNDGWMGISFSFDEPVRLEPGRKLSLRYGLWIHSDAPGTNRLHAAWRRFVALPKPEISGE